MISDLNNIFNIRTEKEFEEFALHIFKYQTSNNIIYSQYLKALKTDTDRVTEIAQIPFMPIEFFKTHQVITNAATETQNLKIFTSSGTTGAIQSKHCVSDISIYEKSYLSAFNLFYGNIEDHCILALLPSYLERNDSSLIYMVDDLIKKSKHPESGFYLDNYSDLIIQLKKQESKKQKTILLGVTYALLDLAEQFPLYKEPVLSLTKEGKGDFNNLIVMETGGMKGKRKEMVREELHTLLCKGFGVKNIHSEYGMTELLSQAYSKGDGIFNCPPWMKILIRDTNDPFSILSHNKTGGINVIDLANINSCSFIATQDLGKLHPDNSFEVLGRFDNSDIRGCNLLV